MNAAEVMLWDRVTNMAVDEPGAPRWLFQTEWEARTEIRLSVCKRMVQFIGRTAQ